MNYAHIFGKQLSKISFHLTAGPDQPQITRLKLSCALSSQYILYSSGVNGRRWGLEGEVPKLWWLRVVYVKGKVGRRVTGHWQLVGHWRMAFGVVNSVRAVNWMTRNEHKEREDVRLLIS